MLSALILDFLHFFHIRYMNLYVLYFRYNTNPCCSCCIQELQIDFTVFRNSKITVCRLSVVQNFICNKFLYATFVTVKRGILSPSINSSMVTLTYISSFVSVLRPAMCMVCQAKAKCVGVCQCPQITLQSPNGPR